MVKNTVINGIDVGGLLEFIEKIKQQPDLAQCTLRAKNTWVDGTYNQAIVKDFYAAGKEYTDREALTFDIDEPSFLGGKNKGAGPVEYLLIALSGCITTTMVTYAAVKGIEVKSVSSRYEGNLDLRGFLNISNDVPIGYQAIRVFFTVNADISDDEKEEILRMGQKYSPVYNTIVNKTTVVVELDKE